MGNDDGMDMDNQSDEDDDFIDEIAMNDEGMLHSAEKEIDAFLASLELVAGPMEVAAPASRKRKAAGGTGTKAKKRKIVVDVNLDWKALAENDELSSLKVKDLKVYLGEQNLSKSGK